MTDENRIKEDVTAFVSNPDNELKYSERGGIQTSTEATSEELSKWKHIEVNIAVTGQSGSGKSTLVNALRGVQDETSPNYAPIGVTETTTTPKEYNHPKNNNVKIWDLPGYGTRRFPFQKYLQDIESMPQQYDAIIIVASSRIYEHDIKLAKALDERRMFYLFARSKCDDDIKGKDQEVANQMLQEIRKDCMNNLKDSSIEEKDVYLISGEVPNHPMLDYEKLSIRILDNLPELKRSALLFSIPLTTEVLLDKKISKLKGRMWSVAGKSCAGAAVPIPGLSLVVDIKLINDETELYKSQLGLNKENLEKVMQVTGIGARELSEKMQFKSMEFTVVSSTGGFAITFLQLMSVLKLVAASELIEKGCMLTPVVGSLVGGAVSFVSTYYTLKYILDAMREDALKIVHILNEERM